METPLNPIQFADLPAARTCYGLGTAVWSAHSRHHVEPDWWIALSGTRYVDYNLALIHGDRPGEVASQVLDEIRTANVPAVIMLAGPGLRAVEPLKDAGWVCTGAMPFMSKHGGTAETDPGFRQLEQHELAAARKLTAAAFDVPDEVGAIVYADGQLDRPDCRTWGLFEDGTLLSCALSVYVENKYSVGWALATAPENQRAGYGRRMVRALAYERQVAGPPSSLVMATDASKHLYDQEGYLTLEYWQIWSRPRWVLP